MNKKELQSFVTIRDVMFSKKCESDFAYDCAVNIFGDSKPDPISARIHQIESEIYSDIVQRLNEAIYPYADVLREEGSVYSAGTAKSLCTCGHTGDGAKSMHLDNPGANGHGPCRAAGCSCEKFTWKEFLPEFVKHMQEG
jgi:hypothetical protein